MLGLAACQPVVPPTAPPTPQVFQVDYTPALRPFTIQLNQCAVAQSDLGLTDREVPADALDLSQSDIAVRWGESAALKGYTAAIGQETLIIITNPENPLRELRLSDLQSLFSGDIKNWSALEPGETFDEAVQIWVTSPGSDDRQIFDSLLSADQRVLPQANLAPDSQAMIEAIATNRGGIGYLPARWYRDSVQKVQIIDAQLSLMQQPILAVTRIEPVNKIQTFLQCLQKQTHIQ